MVNASGRWGSHHKNLNTVNVEELNATGILRRCGKNPARNLIEKRENYQDLRKNVPVRRLATETATTYNEARQHNWAFFAQMPPP
jgi:hypothetical protein